MEAADLGAGSEVLASVGESGARGEPGGVPGGLGRAAGTRGDRCEAARGAGAARTKLPAASREAVGLEVASAREERCDSLAASAGVAGGEAVGVRGERCDSLAASVGVAGGEAVGGRGERRDAVTASAGVVGAEAVGACGEQRAAVVAPAVRVVRGNPDDVEVAALLVALAAVGQAAGAGREETAVPSPRQPLARFVPATSWRAR
ncbi:acyl-CoA carboxylase epsilon subunit [Amycolatopsis sp. M39]|uniref:acyl-CoA carboxylase epsilon subunit n=2 Tax=Amycolatopsis TaxID=1813 RepID=UPI0018E30B5B|nr:MULTISPECIES: acyl-CoA carboxylase epsilon subunit [Amycolatopsis]